MINTTDYSVKSDALKFLSGDIRNYNLPQLPDAEAAEIYERIGYFEANIASPDLTTSGYKEGSAVYADEVFEARGMHTLLTAEHATDHFDKLGNTKEADWGTAGLGMVLHEDTSAHLLVARGRQTGNANSDPEHPLKDRTKSIIVEEKPLLVAGLHGMARGKFISLEDEAAFDVLLGIGNNPNDTSKDLADNLVEAGKDLGLRVGVNSPFVMFKGGKPVLQDDGTVKTNNFKAAGEHTTRAFAQRTAEAAGQSPAALQIELSSLLRYQPRGHELDPKSRIIGVYLGYLLGKRMIELGSGN